MAGDGRIERIDALRGVAALCVCVQHALHPVIVHPATAPTVRAWLSALSVDRFDLGRYGVTLFFLISGYVVPFSLRGECALSRFALTRALRLYPAFWLSVAAVVVTSAVPLSPARVFANLTMAPTLVGRPYVSGVYWTLFVELAFYTACAALYAGGVLRRPGAVLMVGLSCVALPLAGVVLRQVGVPAPIPYLGEHLSFLFAGTLLRSADERAAPAAYAQVLLLVALAAMPILAAQDDHRFTLSTPFGVTCGGAIAVWTFATLRHRAGRVSPALLWLGTVSYSTYLFHIPASRVAERLIPPASTPAALAYLTLTLATTLALAALVYTWVERPMIALGRRWWQRPRAEIAVAP